MLLRLNDRKRFERFGVAQDAIGTPRFVFTAVKNRFVKGQDESRIHRNVNSVNIIDISDLDKSKKSDNL